MYQMLKENRGCVSHFVFDNPPFKLTAVGKQEGQPQTICTQVAKVLFFSGGGLRGGGFRVGVLGDGTTIGGPTCGV